MNGLCNSPPRFDKEAWQFENGLLTPLLWSPCLINLKRKCFLTRKINSHRIALEHQHNR